MDLIDEVYLGGPEDYGRYVPEDMPQPFTVKEYAARMKMVPRYANSVLGVLCAVGVLQRAGQRGRAYLYERVSAAGTGDVCTAE